MRRHQGNCGGSQWHDVHHMEEMLLWLLAALSYYDRQQLTNCKKQGAAADQTQKLTHPTHMTQKMIDSMCIPGIIPGASLPH